MDYLCHLCSVLTEHTMKNHEFRLIDSTYGAAAAREVLISLLNDKIKFINGQIFSQQERFGSDNLHLQKRVTELKKDKGEGDLKIEIKTTGDAGTIDGSNQKIKFFTKPSLEEEETEEIIEIKVDNAIKGEKKPHIVIMKDGEVEIEEGTENVFQYKIMKDGTEGDLTTKATFVFRVVKIVDIKESDEEIPENFRFSDSPKLDESISDLNFYPNPSNGQFKLNFNLENQGNTEISIFDLNGREVYREQLNDFAGSYSKDVNLQGQPSGLYILKISQGEKVMSKKVVIQ